MVDCEQSRVPAVPLLGFIGSIVCVFAMISNPATAEEKDEDLSQHYGFQKLEIFKLERRSANMIAGDLNQDGLTDLILVDNSHSRLDLLQQRKTEPETKASDAKKRSANFIENDWRFEHRKIPVDKQISALALGDFNGDGRTDIAYFGIPDRLVIRHQSKSGDWTERTSFRLADVAPSPWTLAAGDLNHDGRDDLVVLGLRHTYLAYQSAGGKLAAPKTLMNTSQKLGLAQISDLDGDGRNDLCYVTNDDQERSFCARLQGEDGRLGPELRFELNKPRSLSLFNVDGKPGDEIIAIDSRTGRVRVLQLHRPQTKPGELAGRLIQYGFGEQGAGRKRDLAIGDLDGDGLNDVVVSDPEAAQMIVYRQKKGQGLDSGSAYPGLVGAEQVRVADLDGDGSAEVVVLSAREKTLGLSRLKSGRLTFPDALPTVNDPIAVELADLDGDGQDEIVYVARRRGSGNSGYVLSALFRSENGLWKAMPLGKQQSVPIETRGTPRRLMRLDANGDGRPDFLVFVGLDRPPLLLTTNEEGIPAAVTTKGGIGLGEVSEGAVFIGTLDGPVLLAAQRNFARNLKLDENGQWRVLNQYNAVESSARVVGAATLDLDGKPGNEIVLVDAGIRKLRVLRREESLFRPWREVEIGEFPYKSLRVADLNGDGREDLLLFGPGKFAVLYAGQTDPLLKERASFETKLEKTYFADVVAGDLNADGHTDLAVIDTRSHFIELLDFDSKKGLRHALHFKLFEEKSFSRREGGGAEPREVLVTDVTGDGRADLILLTHDRVLVYPQDDGRQPASDRATN